jgi:hypothetical protein
LKILIEREGKGLVSTKTKKGIGTGNIESHNVKLGGHGKLVVFQAKHQDNFKNAH